MRRFYISPQQGLIAETTELDPEESRHITKVLRLQPGVAVELYDGTGCLYQATITEVGKTVHVQIQAKKHFAPPSPALILHCGLLKNKKMELVLQKATELGVASVHLFTSDHTSVTIPNPKKIQRYQKITQESCKQCERLHPLIIYPPTPLQEQLQTCAHDTGGFLFFEREQYNDPSVIQPTENLQELHLFTGPEGGFSTDEISTLPSAIKTISLGQQILRAETAVIAALSIVAYLSGRIKP